MTGQADIDHKRLGEIATLFDEAERAIKEIEDSGGELVVPAINQLRYTGNHLVRYLADPTNTGELDDATRHCKRAAYDAYEASIIYNLLEYQKFKDDYRKVGITAVIPDYIDIQNNIDQSMSFIRDNNKGKTRGDHYEDCRTHLRILTSNVKRLNAGREELNKLIKKAQIKLLFQFFGLLLTVIATAAGVISLFLK